MDYLLPLNNGKLVPSLFLAVYLFIYFANEKYESNVKYKTKSNINSIKIDEKINENKIQ